MIFIFIIFTSFLTLKAQPPPLKFTIGDAEQVADFLPHSGYYPDGGINVIKSLTGNQYYAFWSEFESFRTLANTVDLRDHVGKLNPSGKVIGGRRNDDGAGFSETTWCDGGSWLYGVHRLQDNRLVGFIHCESHWYPRNGDYTAFKSIGMAYSNDDGRTWSINENSQIITPPYAKPLIRRWSGNGDFSVEYNPFNGRFMCYYMASKFLLNNPLGVEPVSPQINLASTTDQTASFLTWMKWNGSDYSQPGRGGNDTPLKNLDKKPGANPSVHYNLFLQRWIIVWYGWDNILYISSSYDGILWADPQVLLSESGDLKFPNVIGEANQIGNQKVRLYYGKDIQSDKSGQRKMMTRELNFSFEKVNTSEKSVYSLPFIFILIFFIHLFI